MIPGEKPEDIGVDDCYGLPKSKAQDCACSVDAYMGNIEKFGFCLWHVAGVVFAQPLRNHL